MMRFLYDFVPVLLFFAVFHFYGIYAATAVGMVTSAFQVALFWFWKRTVDNQQLLTFVLFVIFGSLTLYFHNPVFIMWKPTVLFWAMSITFFVSQFVGQKTLVQRMLEQGIEGKLLDKKIWRRLTNIWSIFFAFLGAANLFVALHFSTAAWVNFKFYGITGLLLLFCFMQAILLSRYMSEQR